MITAFTYEKVQKELITLKEIVQDSMPSGIFVFVGCDNDSIYFNVVSKNPTAEEMDVIVTKTYFQPLSIATKTSFSPYVAKFKSYIHG